jgi:hypothetical protein
MYNIGVGPRRDVPRLPPHLIPLLASPPSTTGPYIPSSRANRLDPNAKDNRDEAKTELEKGSD